MTDGPALMVTEPRCGVMGRRPSCLFREQGSLKLLLHLTASPHLKVASGETFFDQLDQSAPFPEFFSELTRLSEAFASCPCGLFEVL